MKAPWSAIYCDCEYWEPPCAYCCTDAIVAVRENGKEVYKRKSEVKAQE